MHCTIRVKFDSAHQLVLEIAAGVELGSILSTPFRSICRVESALGILHRLAISSEAAGMHLRPDAIGLHEPGKRSQVTLLQSLGPEQVALLLKQLRSAEVLDERPVARRRSDVSGPLRQFSSH